jgi:transcriptional regulator with XRE-family HTH domain
MTSVRGGYMYRNVLPDNLALSGGDKLRNIRIGRRLTLRDVQLQSRALATAHRNEELAISATRLSDIETKGITPGLYKLYALSLVYNLDLLTILAWYGVHHRLSE